MRIKLTKRKLLFVLFILFTSLFASLFSLLNVSQTLNAKEMVRKEEIVTYSPQILGEKVAFNPNFSSDLSSSFETMDVRVYVLDQYIKARNSPLTGMAKLFVDACDRYGAPRDCISLVAIARHETDLCNYQGSAEMHNCMGWGGGGQYRTAFSSYYDMIDRATNVLVNQYGRRYMLNPILMEDVFCGPQAECEGWGARILYFMEEIDTFSESLGFGRLSALR